MKKQRTKDFGGTNLNKGRARTMETIGEINCLFDTDNGTIHVDKNGLCKWVSFDDDYNCIVSEEGITKGGWYRIWYETILTGSIFISDEGYFKCRIKGDIPEIPPVPDYSDEIISFDDIPV